MSTTPRLDERRLHEVAMDTTRMLSMVHGVQMSPQQSRHLAKEVAAQRADIERALAKPLAAYESARLAVRNSRNPGALTGLLVGALTVMAIAALVLRMVWHTHRLPC
jgi:hypothetical protein